MVLPLADSRQTHDGLTFDRRLKYPSFNEPLLLGIPPPKKLSQFSSTLTLYLHSTRSQTDIVQIYQPVQQSLHRLLPFYPSLSSASIIGPMRATPSLGPEPLAAPAGSLRSHRSPQRSAYRGALPRSRDIGPSGATLSQQVTVGRYGGSATPVIYDGDGRRRLPAGRKALRYRIPHTIHW